MRKIIIAMLMVLVALPVYAGMWCEWSGTEGINCQSDSPGYIRLQNGFKVKTESIANTHGIFKVIEIKPSVGTNQKKGVTIWSKADNKINKTWEVIDLTIDEIDKLSARPMPLSEYYLWKVLVLKGVVTKAELTGKLPQKLIDAYLARERLDK